MSTEPDMATEDSSLNLTQLTVPRCPRNFRHAWPDETSHKITVLSIPHDTM